jgi:hypothetical protein
MGQELSNAITKMEIKIDGIVSKVQSIEIMTTKNGVRLENLETLIKNEKKILDNHLHSDEKIQENINKKLRHIEQASVKGRIFWYIVALASSIFAFFFIKLLSINESISIIKTTLQLSDITN